MSDQFASGWCLVSETDGSTATRWVQPYPLPGPALWVIAGRTRDDCAGVTTCAFVAELREFEEHMLISRLEAPSLVETETAQ